MKSIKITSNKIGRTHICPTSKSYANRLLVMAAMTEDEVLIRDIPRSQDVLDMLFFLKAIGLDVKETDNSVTITNSFPECEKISQAEINLTGSEGGTTIRFLLPLLSLGQNKYIVSLDGHMVKRPMDNLIQSLYENGVEIRFRDKKIEIKGPLNKKGKFQIDCSKTTQFASALLHLKVKKDLDYVYQLDKIISSKKYLDLTYHLIEQFKETNEFYVEPDASSLGYFLVYGALFEEINLSNVKRIDAFQADSKMFNVLEMVGCEFNFNNGLVVKPKRDFSSGFSVDGSDCIDLVPTLMFLASFIPFESKITNIRFLKYKESDRLDVMLKLLRLVGVNFSYNESVDELVIKGQKTYPAIEAIESVDDHRMIMIAALFLKKLGGGTLSPYRGVKKSFPSFFSSFNS